MEEALQSTFDTAVLPKSTHQLSEQHLPNHIHPRLLTKMLLSSGVVPEAPGSLLEEPMLKQMI